jgi:2-dehydropantoate 2-reductase
MRVLVVGAGALGGYFGGRLAEAGRDVTFLVRPHRAEQISRHGLRIDSLHGNADLRPRLLLTGEVSSPYDLVLLTVKAYSLPAAMDDLAPAVGPETAILPVINGMRHLDALIKRFGTERILGGLAQIAATLGPEGQVIHRIGPLHNLVYGELRGGTSERVRAIVSAFERAKFESRASEQIMQEMWEKWVGLATLAGMTCLMRGSVGDIFAAPSGRDAMLALLDECRATATAAGYEPRPAFVEFATSMLKAGSPLTASMLRDIERGGSTEGEHVLGDLVAQAESLGVPTPLLRLARCHVAAYEARRTREQAGR